MTGLRAKTAILVVETAKGENGGENMDHGSDRIVPLRAAYSLEELVLDQRASCSIFWGVNTLCADKLSFAAFAKDLLREQGIPRGGRDAEACRQGPGCAEKAAVDLTRKHLCRRHGPRYAGHGISLRERGRRDLSCRSPETAQRERERSSVGQFRAYFGGHRSWLRGANVSGGVRPLRHMRSKHLGDVGIGHFGNGLVDGETGFVEA